MSTIRLAAHAAGTPPLVAWWSAAEPEPAQPKRQRKRLGPEPPPADGDRRCCRCGESKPPELFVKRNRLRSGRDTICKACRAAQERERRGLARNHPHAPAKLRPATLKDGSR